MELFLAFVVGLTFGLWLGWDEPINKPTLFD